MLVSPRGNHELLAADDRGDHALGRDLDVLDLLAGDLGALGDDHADKAGDPGSDLEQLGDAGAIDIVFDHRRGRPRSADRDDVLLLEQRQVVGVLNDRDDPIHAQLFGLERGDDVAAVVVGRRDRHVDVVEADLLEDVDLGPVALEDGYVVPGLELLAPRLVGLDEGDLVLRAAEHQAVLVLGQQPVGDVLSLAPAVDDQYSHALSLSRPPPLFDAVGGVARS